MRQHGDDADERCDEIDPAHAGEEQQSAADDPEQQRRAEIGLVQAQGRRGARPWQAAEHGIGP